MMSFIAAVLLSALTLAVTFQPEVGAFCPQRKRRESRRRRRRGFL